MASEGKKRGLERSTRPDVHAALKPPTTYSNGMSVLELRLNLNFSTTPAVQQAYGQHFDQPQGTLSGRLGRWSLRHATKRLHHRLENIFNVTCREFEGRFS